jgi:hypothetical protein
MVFLAFEYVHTICVTPNGGATIWTARLYTETTELTPSLSQQPTVVPKSWIDGSVGQFLSQIRDEVVGSLELGDPRLIPQIMRRVVSYNTHNTLSS